MYRCPYLLVIPVPMYQSVFAGYTGANISIRINNFRYVNGQVYDIYNDFLK